MNSSVAELERESLNSESDAPDVALASSGDRGAFERLYHQNVGRVFAICARMVNDRGAAEELTQDVFVRAWEKLGQFRGESAFSTWLHRLAVNLVLNARKSEGRARSRFQGGEDELDLVPVVSASPLTAIDLEGAVALLPAGARQIFVLHDIEGFKHEEIAEMLSITAGGSKAQLHRARMLLRKALQR